MYIYRERKTHTHIKSKKTRRVYVTEKKYKMDDMMDSDMLPPPPSDDAPSGAPSFGGWELLALLSLRDKNPELLQRSVKDPQFNVNTHFEITASSPKHNRSYSIAFGRVKAESIKERGADGKLRTDVTFDAPSDTKTGKVFKNVDDCYHFQDFLIAYDKHVGPRHRVIDVENGMTRHDSLLFSIIRNKYFFLGGRSTGILEMLAKIPKESRRYPNLNQLDGQGRDIYEVCETLNDPVAMSILEKAFPNPEKSGGCCIIS